MDSALEGTEAEKSEGSERTVGGKRTGVSKGTVMNGIVQFRCKMPTVHMVSSLAIVDVGPGWLEDGSTSTRCQAWKTVVRSMGCSPRNYDTGKLAHVVALSAGNHHGEKGGLAKSP